MKSRTFVAAAKPAVVLLAMALAGCVSLSGKDVHFVKVSSAPVALDTAIADRMHLGQLFYLGGLVLSSPDRTFGGLSSIRWHGARLYALSDQDGASFDLEPIERDGKLIGVGKVRGTRLRDVDGTLLSGKQGSDAESMDLAIANCGRPPCRITSMAVGLERDDRVLVYGMRRGIPVGKPRRLRGVDDWLGRQPDNLGVEAMAGDRSITLMVSEGLRTASGEASALLFRPGVNGRTRLRSLPIEIGVPAPGEERPSDLVQIDPRTFIMLRRSWSRETGFTVSMDRLEVVEDPEGPRVTSSAVARFEPPVQTDNFEGVAVRHEDGRTFLYVVSDDNFDEKQRTLLLKFELVGR